MFGNSHIDSCEPMNFTRQCQSRTPLTSHSVCVGDGVGESSGTKRVSG